MFDDKDFNIIIDNKNSTKCPGCLKGAYQLSERMEMEDLRSTYIQIKQPRYNKPFLQHLLLCCCGASSTS